MMNQYYGFSGRGSRGGSRTSPDRGYDRAPYRRSMGQSGMYPYGTQNPPRASTSGGCGCGLNRSAHPHDGHGHGDQTRHDRNRTSPAMNQGCGCGCGGHNGGRPGSDCSRLMDQIRAVDFALYETVLYLDVYPDSCDALETYHKLKEQSQALHREYEATHGPLTAFSNQSTASWDWMSKPFPWEYDAD